MSSFSLSTFFPYSNRNSKNPSILLESETTESNFSRQTPLQSKFNIQQKLILPSIDKNISHKKIHSDFLSKSTKARDSYNSKEALKDWLIGKQDVTIDQILNKQQSNKQIERINIITPPTNDSSQNSVQQTSKRRFVRNKRFSQDIQESGSFSTLDSTYNLQEYQPQIGGSAQTIQLPRVLESMNQLNINKDSPNRIKLNNNTSRRLVKKVSIDIFDDQLTPTNQNNNFEQKSMNIKNNSQQSINFGNSNSNQRYSENIFSYNSNNNNNNNNTSSSLFFAQSSGRQNSPESDNSTPVKLSSETKITYTNSIFQPSSNVHRFGSLQTIIIPDSIQEKSKKQINLFDTYREQQSNNNSNDSPIVNSKLNETKRSGYRKYVAQSMGQITLPDSINKQQTTKSILKDRSTKHNTLPPILKKSVIFNKQVEEFHI